MSELRKALSSFESLLEQTRADAELQSELKRLNMWLRQFDKLDVDELCGTSGVPNAPTRSTGARAQIDSAIVDDFSAKLSRLENESSDLESILSEMKSDKRVRIAE